MLFFSYPPLKKGCSTTAIPAHVLLNIHDLIIERFMLIKLLNTYCVIESLTTINITKIVLLHFRVEQHFLFHIMVSLSYGIFQLISCLETSLQDC